MSPGGLAYVAHALPGEDARARLALAASLDLALEVAHGLGEELDLALELGHPIVTLQAWGLHELDPLSARAAVRLEALRYATRVLEVAARSAIPRVLVVCGFGQAGVPDPLSAAQAWLSALAPVAREAGTRVLIEMLGPARASALTEPQDHARLHAALAAPEVFAGALDTGHLLDGGRDPESTLRAWSVPLEELQLRAAGSRAPTTRLPLAAWLRARAEPPPVVAIEHARATSASAVERITLAVRALLAEGR